MNDADERRRRFSDRGDGGDDGGDSGDESAGFPIPYQTRQQPPTPPAGTATAAAAGHHHVPNNPMYMSSTYLSGTDSNPSLQSLSYGTMMINGTANDSLLDMALSPTSTVSSSDHPNALRHVQGSPLLGEMLVGTDTEGEEEASLLPTRLRLPPTTSTSSAAAGRARGGGLHQPHDALGRLDVRPAAIGGGGAGPPQSAESPSSVNAQPGDWEADAVAGIGGGVGGIGASTTDAAGGGGYASLYRGARGGTPFATFVRFGVVVAVLVFTAALAVILSNSPAGAPAAGGVVPGGSSSGAPNSSGGGGGPTAQQSPSSSSSSSSAASAAAPIPFPHVDRSTYGDAAGKIVNAELFEPRLLRNPVGSEPDNSATSADATNKRGGASGGNNGTDAAAAVGGDRRRNRRRLAAAATDGDGERTASSPSSAAVASFLKVPFPTGAFWTNLVLKPTTDKGLSYPIVSYPYAYKWSPSTLVASYPSLRRKVDDTSVRDTFNPDLVFSISEAVAKRHVVAFDPLSVTLRFLAGTAGDRTSYWESYIVRGSPYVTIMYKNSTPFLKPLSTFQSVMCPRDGEGNYNNAKEYEKNSKPPATAGGGDQGGGSSGGSDKRNTGGSWGVCSSVGGESPSDKYVTLTGVQFLFQTQENLTWMVFASSPISLRFDHLGKRTIEATKPFTGVLRFALVPPPSDDSGSTDTGVPGFHDGVELSSSSGVRRLIYHASVYPVGGDVSWEFQDGSSSSSGSKIGQAITGLVGGVVGNAAEKFSVGDGSKGQLPPNRLGTIKFRFDTMSMTDGDDNKRSFHDQLLMLALPHHAKLMESGLLRDDKQFDLEYLCIKGKMRPVVGDTWEYEEALPSTGFDDAGALEKLSTMDDGVRKMILDQVEKDMKRVLPTFDENVYGFGKQVARLAQLVHIGHMLSPQTAGSTRRGKKGTETPLTTQPFVQEGMDTLQNLISTFLRNGQKDKLLFDGNFGGIVTKDGLEDTQADFGNGRFNDHHFHYGYMLYSCAIMGKYNSTFVSEYGAHVDAILYDVAYSSNADSASRDDNFFPLTRHINWYDGHSFASGLFPYGNGKSQESSSEAVNCYYGVSLWSMIRWGDRGDGGADGKGGTDFARLLLAMEIRGARTYWHMTPPVGDAKDSSTHLDVYQPSFTKNYMVGNLGMMDAVCSTWFGTSKLYVHMINFVPLTAITATLFDQDYVKGEFTKILKPLYSGAEMAWKGYVVGDHAIIDPNSAWRDALKLISYELDAALSLSQLLYFISTRKDFISPPTSANNATPEEDLPTNASSSSACETNPKCVDLGLSGECCPTVGGDFLGCCKSSASGPAPSPSESDNATKENESSSSSSCEANPACANLGLSGNCCPTLGGGFLGCCKSFSSNKHKSPAKLGNNTKAEKTPARASTGMASACEENTDCADTGLSGECCPTEKGDYLGCCGQQR